MSLVLGTAPPCRALPASLHPKLHRTGNGIHRRPPVWAVRSGSVSYEASISDAPITGFDQNSHGQSEPQERTAFQAVPTSKLPTNRDAKRESETHDGILQPRRFHPSQPVARRRRRPCSGAG